MSSTCRVVCSVKRVTDFGIGEINIPPDKWRSLPGNVQEKLLTYNTNADAFVRGPRVDGVVCYHLVVANYRVDEILADLAALNA